MRNVWKEAADGLTLFAAYEIVKTAIDIICQPAAWSSPFGFIAGAGAMAALLFVDYYVAETCDV
jgi:hypothetical protein